MSFLSQARRIVLLHPAVQTLIWLFFGVLGDLLFPHISAIALVSMICAWIWAIYVVSTAKTPQDSHPMWTGWVFLAPPLLVVITEVAKLPTSNSPMAFLVLGTLFLCLWRAAQALEYADNRGGQVTVGRILGTMVLMLFSIVGFWWLRQRLVRVAGATAA